MSNKALKLEKGAYLFKEGDSSTCMYLIKSGRLAVTRKNFTGDDEVILSEKVNGELIGEMAFFDSKPRSANVKALTLAEVIELPFSALQEQFNACPAWIKVMVKTVNAQLRDANTRIKNLENIVSDTKDKLMPQTLLRAATVVDILCYQGQEDDEGNKVFPYKEAYNVLCQIFHQNKQKINKALKALKELNLLDIVDMGEAGQMVVVSDQETIHGFTVWYNENMAKDTGDQVAIEEKELPVLNVLAYYGQEDVATEIGEGVIKVHVDHMQKNAKADLHINFSPTSIEGLMKKKIVLDKQADDKGIWISYNLEELVKIFNYWTLIHAYNNSADD